MRASDFQNTCTADLLPLPAIEFDFAPLGLTRCGLLGRSQAGFGVGNTIRIAGKSRKLTPVPHIGEAAQVNTR